MRRGGLTPPDPLRPQLFEGYWTLELDCFLRRQCRKPGREKWRPMCCFVKIMAVQALSHPNSPVSWLGLASVVGSCETWMVRTEVFLHSAGRLHSCWCFSKQPSFTHFPFLLLLASHETSHQLSCSLTSVLDSWSSAVPCFLWTGAPAATRKHSSGWLLLLLSCNQMQVPPGL